MDNKKNKNMVIVSSCLAGVKCRYDGSDQLDPVIAKMVADGLAIPVCPEQLAGLETPRTPCEIRGQEVFRQDGKNTTKIFNKGAKEALALAKLINAKEAFLKNKSPMCGCGEIYDGSFSGKLQKGDGIFTQMLKKYGIRVNSIK